MSANKSLQKKTFVVFNPAAGRAGREQILNKIEQVLIDHHIPHTIYETSKQDDLHSVVETAIHEDYQRFLVAGGDGTVSGAASGLINTKIPLIIIPTGTSNALAKVFQVPVNLDDSIDWWVSARKIKTIDAMQVKKRFYVLNISTGVSSKALSDVKRQDKRRWGSLAYLLRGFQQLLGISPYKFQITIDGQTYHRRASEVVVANSGIAQFNLIRLNPEIKMDDGKLSVCHIRVRDITDFFRIAGNMTSGQSKDPPTLACRDAFREVSIQADKRLPIQADGEIIGSTPISIKLVPAAINFLLPDDSAK